MKIVLTQHVVDRYVERVKPALTREMAEHELRVLCYRTTFVAKRPGWVISRMHDFDLYGEISPGVCVTGHREKHLLILRTCLTNCGMNDLQRARKNRQRSSRTSAARLRKRRELAA